MEHIDNAKLYQDDAYRFEYVAKFVDFGEHDIKAIESVADKIRPLVPVVVDAVYDKLFKFDVTKKFFVPKNEGFDGQAPASLEELTLDHPQIKFRKDFLSRYLHKLLNGPYDARMIRYLSWVAKIHIDTPEKKSKINVDYVHINALMGFVETTLVGGIMSLNLDRETEGAALSAFNKLLWIQNDFFARFYMKPIEPAKKPAASCCAALEQFALLPAIVGAVVGAAAIYFGYVHRA
ncbi:Protoglobin-domain-containing protein [Gongronella butleri]|nr:Protoglobin-domain-containing protein [Gongronella butleri]